jgi:NAD(P)-dependent dehydrogenase (short-subunit alcohol dehydrogenase family)
MRALVTGASHGIGGATCLKLAEQALARGEKPRIAATATGARPDLKELVAQLQSMGAEAIGLTGDLGAPGVPARLVAEAVEFCGGLDALVSNAAMRHMAPLLELDESKWDDVFAVNTKATWLLGRAAHPALKASRGAIVAVSSIAGLFPFPNYGPYSPSKAALVSLCEQMANEWAKDGIRVNCVSPGIVKTKVFAETYVTDPELARRRDACVPMGRVAEAPELAAAIAMLLSPEASYITAQNLVVDGGLTSALMTFIPRRAKLPEVTGGPKK